MRNLTRTMAAGLLATTAILVGGAPPATAAANEDYFVVNTQDPGEVVNSPVVEAGGAFSGCTTVTDLWGIGEEIGPNKVMFIGEKQVNCPGGVVVIHYNATLNFQKARRTSGHWWIVTEESTLAGATEGSGTVRGDNARCEPIAPSEFCILDTFAGTTE